MIKKAIIDLSSLERPAGANASGLRQIRLIPAHLVSWLDAQRSKLGPGDLRLLPGALPIDIETDADSCTWSEDMSETTAGIVYTSSISFTIPAERSELRDWIQHNQKVRWLALSQDRNFICRLHGNLQTPLRLASAWGAGSGRTGKNLRSFGLTASCLLPSPYITTIRDEFFNQDLYTPEFDNLTFH